MKQCPICGKIIYDDNPEYDDARFCPDCGREGKLVVKAKCDGDARKPPVDEEDSHEVKTTVNGTAWHASSFDGSSSTAVPEKDSESAKKEEDEVEQKSTLAWQRIKEQKNKIDMEEKDNSRLGNVFDERNSPYSDDAINNKINDKTNKINSKTNKINEKVGRGDNDHRSGNVDDAQSPVKFQDIVNYKPDSRDCLKVEINYNVFAISGLNSVIQLRLTPLSDELEDVEVFWKLGENDEMKQAKLDIAVENGCEIPVSLEFVKERAGFYDGKFFFLCKTQNGDKRYMFSETCQVYNGNEKMQPGNFAFHIENNPKHAADIRNNVINIASQGYTINQLLDQLRKIPQYGTKRLYVTKREFEKEVVRQESSDSPKTPPTPSAQFAERILLRVGNYRLFVLSKSSITLGRVKEDNDLQIQIPGKPDYEKPNSYVSGKHGVLEIVDREKIRYMDKSSNGTLLNGRPAPCKQFTELPEKHGTLMTFGGKGGVELSLKPYVDKQNGDISLVLTHRDNHIREGYVIVPHSIHLGDVFNGMDGFRLFSRNGYFFLTTPDGKENTLHEGSVVRYKNITITAEEFIQS